RAWQDASGARAAAEAEIAAARRDEAYLRHAGEELAAMKPEPGEEARLAEQRSLLMHRAKLEEALQAALDDLTGERSGESLLNQARRRLDRLSDKAGGRLDPAVAALDRAQAELAEAVQQRNRPARDLHAAPRRPRKLEGPVVR